MVTITLPPELEQTVTERALQQGTTPELLVLNELRQIFTPVPPLAAGQSMADYLKEFIGCIDSSETYPEGSRLSENTGRKFGELLQKKKREGKL